MDAVVILDRLVDDADIVRVCCRVFCVEPAAILVRPAGDLADGVGADARVVCCKQVLAGEFPLLLEFLSNDPDVHGRDFDVAIHMCAMLGVGALFSTNDANPYVYYYLGPDLGARFASLDADELDTSDRFKVKSLLAAPIGRHGIDES